MPQLNLAAATNRANIEINFLGTVLSKEFKRGDAEAF